MGQLIIRNVNSRDFLVRLNLPPQIRQVWVPNRHVITSIRCLPNPIRHVIPLIACIRLYPPHHSHLHPHSIFFSSTTCTIIAELKVKSSLSISPCDDHELTSSTSIPRVQHTRSTAYTEYSIHRVQHKPSTAYTDYSIPRVQHTQECLTSHHSHHDKLTPDCCFGFRRASRHNRLPSASPPWELKGNVTMSPCHIPTSPSQLTDAETPSAYTTLLNHGLQRYL